LLDGIIVRRVTLAGRRSAELLGAGDLIRPHQAACDPYALVASRAEWQTLHPVRAARLDEDLTRGLATLPGVLSELAARAVERSRALAVRMAIAQIPNLEARIELLLWHLADRWGRRERGKVTLPVRLPQGLLAELACAHRTSVNSALRELVCRGVVESQGTGRWALVGDPPAACVAEGPSGR
jgi:CRP-like cAMP-binding protein